MSRLQAVSEPSKICPCLSSGRRQSQKWSLDQMYLCYSRNRDLSMGALCACAGVPLNAAPVCRGRDMGPSSNNPRRNRIAATLPHGRTIFSCPPFDIA